MEWERSHVLDWVHRKRGGGRERAPRGTKTHPFTERRLLSEVSYLDGYVRMYPLMGLTITQWCDISDMSELG